ERALRRIESQFEGALEVDRIESLPLLVVVGAGGISDAPPCHGAARIMPGGLLEAAHGLLVIEAIGPNESAIEPRLRFHGLGGDRPPIVAKVIVVCHLITLVRPAVEGRSCSGGSASAMARAAASALSATMLASSSSTPITALTAGLTLCSRTS